MKKSKGRRKGPRKRELAKALDERALARGVKPFTTVKDAARMTPEDGDELLAAIRLLREDCS
jgi:hypothetical protein